MTSNAPRNVAFRPHDAGSGTLCGIVPDVPKLWSLSSSLLAAGAVASRAKHFRSAVRVARVRALAEERRMDGRGAFPVGCDGHRESRTQSTATES